MKKYRRTLSILTLLMLLNGCAAQTQTIEAEPPTKVATEPTESPPTIESEPTETEETIPVRETAEMAESASVTEPTTPAGKDQSRGAGSHSATEPIVTQPPARDIPATEPPVTDIPVLETEATIPPATEPQETAPPATTEPVPTEPTPSETEPEETESTVPPVEVIDTAALEAYGRSYASSTYGYNGTSACNTSTGAGYFPAATKKITSMDEGYSIVRQAIDSQYKRDAAYGYSPYEEIDGKTVRCPINIRVSATGEPNVYSITVYYGGSA